MACFESGSSNKGKFRRLIFNRSRYSDNVCYAISDSDGERRLIYRLYTAEFSSVDLILLIRQNGRIKLVNTRRDLLPTNSLTSIRVNILNRPGD